MESIMLLDLGPEKLDDLLKAFGVEEGESEAGTAGAGLEAVPAPD